MKRIKLTQGKYAKVSEEDYLLIKQHNWCASYDKVLNSFYAIRKTPVGIRKQKTLRMHREIMNCPDGMEVDHIDGDTLNNQRDNLRICTHAQNVCNKRISKHNLSGYKGVTKSGKSSWWARIRFKGVQQYLGSYSSPEEASMVYEEKAKELFGEFAKS